MNIKIEAHDNHKFQRKLDAVPSWMVPISTQKEIVDFIAKAAIGQVNEGRRLSNRTLSKNLSLLKRCLETVNKPTSNITKEDIERFDKKLVESELKSVANYRVCLKVFLKWKLGEYKMRKLAGWLDTRDKTKTPDYLSEQEVNKLFRNTKNTEEKFMIAILFDAGARAEEFLNIRLEDIQIPEESNNFVKLTLKEEYSKTKGRVVSLYWKHSLDSVREFLKERVAEGARATDPLFIKSYDAMRMFLARLGQKVLHKKVNPHLFRHSSATYYATKLNRQELCYRYGWKFSSDMPDVYISRAGMESKVLDEKFKATELEVLEKKMASDRFENQKEMENIKEANKLFADNMGKLMDLLQEDPEASKLLFKRNMVKMEELFS